MEGTQIGGVIGGNPASGERAMDDKARNRRLKLLAACEGYTALGMYQHALESLGKITCDDGAVFDVNIRRGEVLRQLERHDEALVAFHRAFDDNPDDVDLLMAMAWCYKRTNQLPRAITSMEQAYRIAPKQPVILYNLSCYWSLAGNKMQSLSWLGRALRMDKGLRRLIDDESDFDPLRHDPDFQMILGAIDQKKG
ncbi:MAG: tetratricopeptide repeat protein [Planctomycetia bacterium]|nr:tetratricopeptide repeat protein [Planctomycetia bacterium]